MNGGAALLWGPEVVLALSSLLAAAVLARRPGGGAIFAVAIALLAADAALGAAEYMELGGAAFAGPHAFLTAAFKTAGLAAAVAAVAADALPGLPARRFGLAGGVGFAALAASAWVTLLPVLLLAHAAAALVRPHRRTGDALAAAALAGVAVSQIALPPGDLRTALLHLGLSAWAGSLVLRPRREASGGPAAPRVLGSAPAS